MGDWNLMADQLQKGTDTSHTKTDTWEEAAPIVVVEALVAVAYHSWRYILEMIQNYGKDHHRCCCGSRGFLQTYWPATLGNAVARDERSSWKITAVNDAGHFPSGKSRLAEVGDWQEDSRKEEHNSEAGNSHHLHQDTIPPVQRQQNVAETPTMTQADIVLLSGLKEWMPSPCGMVGTRG